MHTKTSAPPSPSQHSHAPLILNPAAFLTFLPVHNISPQTITYQAVLTTDGFRSYVLMLYQAGGMQWDYTRLAATNVLIGYTRYSSPGPQPRVLPLCPMKCSARMRTDQMGCPHPYSLTYGGFQIKFVPLVLNSWAVLALRSTHPSGVPGLQCPGGLGGSRGEKGMFAELCAR